MKSKAVNLIAALFLISIGNFAFANPEQRPQKNVLLILIDDLNDWVRPLGGYALAKTPNLKYLSSRGVKFNYAYSNAPICSPSRASLFSGKLPSSTGHYGFQLFRKVHANRHAVTMVQHFKNKGYYTIGNGKVFHGVPKGERGAKGDCDPISWTSYIPNKNQTSGSYFKTNNMGEVIHTMVNNKPKYDERAVKMGTKIFGPTKLKGYQTRDGSVANVAIQNLKRLPERPEYINDEQPFFLAAGFKLPHTPWVAPEKYFDMYPLESIVLPEVPDDDLEDIPASTLAFMEDHLNKDFYDSLVEDVHKKDKWKKLIRCYLACITFIDHQVGRIIKELEANPELNANTVVVLASDHGYHLGEKHHFHKYTLWEESGRVPMIISVPGISPKVCNTPVSLVDLYPTLTDICGIKDGQPNNLDGTSLVPLLNDPNRNWDKAAISMFGFKNFGVRYKHWKYIRFRDGGEELYNLKYDPNEWKNLADSDQQRHTKAKELLKGFIPQNPKPTAMGTQIENMFPVED